MANGLQLQIQGTGNTQCFYTEAFVTLTSTITSAGKIIIPAIGGLVNITEGKIIL